MIADINGPIRSSEDDGKTWKTAKWPRGISYALSAQIVTGQPLLVVPSGGRTSFDGALLFSMQSLLEGVEPSPMHLNLLGSVNDVCPLNAGPLTAIMPAPQQATLTARMEDTGVVLPARRRLVHGLATGSSCSSTYQLASDQEAALLYPDRAGWSGWRFKRSDDQEHALFAAEPIACK